jgi:hypothetical protein
MHRRPNAGPICEMGLGGMPRPRIVSRITVTGHQGAVRSECIGASPNLWRVPAGGRLSAAG